jgi:hypothetical protein
LALFEFALFEVSMEHNEVSMEHKKEAFDAQGFLDLCDLGKTGEDPQRESGTVARTRDIAELYRTVEANMAWWFYGVNARGDDTGDERLAPGGRSYFNALGELDLLGLAQRLRDAYGAFPFLN